MTQQATEVRLSDCVGLWRRTLLINTDGSEDTTTDVQWLQGRTAFVDLRRPRPLTHLADQDGFAGWVTQDRDVFTWARFTGLQPPGPNPDAGRMRWENGVLIEEGVHEDYVEHWERDPADEQSCWALTLRGEAGETALLVRVGQRFGWADSGGPLIALGEVRDDRWVITDSSLPTAEGTAHAVLLRDTELRIVSADGDSTARHFRVIDSEGTVKP